jgi:O-antigen ligase
MVSAAAALLIFGMIEMRKSGRVALLGGTLTFVSLFLLVADPLANTRNDLRWPLWAHILQAVDSAPLGRGLGSFREIFPYFIAGDPRVAANWEFAHNEYLQALFEMGVQTLLFLTVFLVSLGHSITRCTGRTENGVRIAAGLAATALSCVGWFTFHEAPLALVGCAWLGMAENMTKSQPRGDFAHARGGDRRYS